MNEENNSFKAKRNFKKDVNFFTRVLDIKRRSSLPERNLKKASISESLTDELRKRKSTSNVRRQSCQTSRMEQNFQDNEYRVILFGGGSVGKSSLVWRFLCNTFKETYTATIEDTYTHVINCGRNVCTLLITDTSGTYSFPAMRKLAISRGNAFLIVYSISSRSTFDDAIKIYDQMKKERGNLENVPLYLVGNKSDEDERKVTFTEGENLSKSWNCGFIETSAKTNSNVDELFKKLLALESARSISLEKACDSHLVKNDNSFYKQCLIM